MGRVPRRCGGAPSVKLVLGDEGARDRDRIELVADLGAANCLTRMRPAVCRTQ